MAIRASKRIHARLAWSQWLLVETDLVLQWTTHQAAGLSQLLLCYNSFHYTHKPAPPNTTHQNGHNVYMLWPHVFATSVNVNKKYSCATQAPAVHGDITGISRQRAASYRDGTLHPASCGQRCPKQELCEAQDVKCCTVALPRARQAPHH